MPAIHWSTPSRSGCPDQGRAEAIRSPRWGRSSPASIATRWRAYLDSGRDQGATLRVDGRDHALHKDGEGFFLGVSLLDHVTPQMDCYRNEIFGPVLEVVRVPTYADAMQVIEDNPYANGTAIYTRDGGAAAVPVRRQRGHGRRQRADPRARGLLQLRWLEGVAVRRPAHVRAGGHPVLHARQGGDGALARSVHLKVDPLPRTR